jgi:hypothetical protein
MPNYVQLNQNSCSYVLKNIFPIAFQFEYYFRDYGLLYFQSWGFFQLEAKYAQVLDDWKQCNRSYIFMTSTICTETDISEI